MNEPTDKPLHDWVRETLHSYRPAYDPQDWERVQRRLRRRRWWRRGVVGSMGLIALFAIRWFGLPTIAPEAIKIVSLKKAPAIHEPIPAKPTPGKIAQAAVVTNYIRYRSVRKAIVQSPKANSTARVLSKDITPITAHNQLVPLPTNITEQIQQPLVIAFSPEETAIRQQMLTSDFGPDSTSYQTLTRNLRQWPNAVVVCDLTSSMYPYSTQLFAWFRQNARNLAVKGIVFFTDCDSLGQQTQPGGSAGQMFVTRERDGAKVLPLMLEAARNTVQNYDEAENDVEALLFAQKMFPEARHLILLADNLSRVKDMHRLEGVRKPVHVVLCGTTEQASQPFQPDYYTIASRTNGSLHTLEDDLNPNTIPRHTMLRVGTHYYRYNVRKGQFRLTSFTRRPIHLFGFVWL